MVKAITIGSDGCFVEVDVQEAGQINFPYSESVTANNEVSTNSSTFTDLLQNNFVIPNTGTYELGYVLQYRATRNNRESIFRVRIDGVEQTDIGVDTSPARSGEPITIRRDVNIWTELDFTAGDNLDIDLQFASSNANNTVFVYYRRLYLRQIA